MKITREPLGENLERFEVTIARSDWYGEYEKELRKARREMAVPGFRKGQAPLGLVAKRLGGEEWMFRFVDEVQSRELGKYLDAEDLHVAYPFVPSDADVPMPDFKAEETVRWRYDVVVAPKFELPKQLAFVPVEVEATDGQWAACEEAVLADNMTWEATDAVAAGALIDAELLNAPAVDGVEPAADAKRMFFSYDEMTDDARALFSGKRVGEEVELPAGMNPYAGGEEHGRVKAFAQRVEKMGMQGVPLRVRLVGLERRVQGGMSWEYYDRYFALSLQNQAEGRPAEAPVDDVEEVRTRFRDQYVEMVRQNAVVSNGMAAFSSALEGWDWRVPEEHLKKMLAQDRLGSMPVEYELEFIKRDILGRQLLRELGEDGLERAEYKAIGERLYDLHCMDALRGAGVHSMYGVLPGAVPVARYFMQSFLPQQMENKDFQSRLRSDFAYAAGGHYLLGKLNLKPRKVGVDQLTERGEAKEDVEARAKATQEKWARWREQMSAQHEAARAEVDEEKAE